MELFILKTNVRSLTMKEELALQLDGIPQIITWSVDYQDCDGVLRASVAGICIDELIGVVKKSGFECEELND
ncbi:hypothetical protein [Emticicia sp. BO119]|uniref:hypothetical protein n=1 Tax=Emticicia sp. BO119 TaxID=2757768 RepID=UPI0015F0F81B|nr:hypothetical protein [Emticicia sp. BO119]MBA4852165.1 hypothetical protein [Emticicia sp. BO119]